MIEKQKIKAKVLIEIVGAPKEHIENTTQLLAEQFGKEQGLSVLKTKISPAEKVNIGKIKQDMFSSFIEIEALFDDLNVLGSIMFLYMPSHIEVIEPDNVVISADEISGVLTSLAAKLHETDMVAKKLKAQVAILARELEKQKTN